MKSNELYNIIMKLNGQIHPSGKHEVDQERLENLKNLIDLTDELLTTIDRLGGFRRRHEISVREIGETAYQYSKDLYEGYKECFEEEEE